MESLLASVEQFAIETAGKQRRVSRQELEALAGQAPKAEQERQE